MKVNSNLLLTISIILVLLFGGYYFNQLINNNHKNYTEIVELSKNATMLTLAANDYEVKKMLKEFKSENSKILDAYESERKKNKELLKEIAEINYKLKQTRMLNINSDKIYDKHKDKQYWYFFKLINIVNDKGENVPIAWAMFYPYREQDKQWKIGTFELTSDTKIIISETKDGKNKRYVENHLYSKGKELPIKNSEIKWAIKELNEKLFSFNPRIALGMTVADKLRPELNISLASYGKTNIDMDFRFLTFGLTYDKEIIGSISPVEWNIGKTLPIIENVFLGPNINWNFKNEVGYGLKLSVPF